MTLVPTFDLSGRVALVTGASSGLGMRYARLLAAAGARVVLAARRVNRLEALAAEIGVDRAIAVEMDVADERSTIAAYDAAEAAFGAVDTIVANAGVENESRVVDMDVAVFDQTMAVNLRGVFLTTREGARRLLKGDDPTRGRMVITCSITARTIWPGTTVYSASKAGVLQMGKLLAREWARPGINVNMILPGYFHSEMAERWVDSDFGRKLIDGFPRRRLLEEGNLDVPLLFLCSDLSRGVTGAEFTIDDGQSL
jgi:NAD(P)-dependent dehydrogenase (short-subunit alcohol dehydrogenase family)